MRRLLLLALTLLLPLAVTACGDDDGSPTLPTVENTTFAPSLGVDLAAMTRTPSGLYVRDLAVGTGAVPATGQTAVLHYTVHISDGQLVDSNQPPQAPFGFRVGVDPVIAGFEEGVRGMRAGGRRQLVIPPQLGYADVPNAGELRRAVLVFTVHLVEVR